MEMGQFMFILRYVDKYALNCSNMYKFLRHSQNFFTLPLREYASSFKVENKLLKLYN